MLIDYFNTVWVAGSDAKVQTKGVFAEEKKLADKTNESLFGDEAYKDFDAIYNNMDVLQKSKEEYEIKRRAVLLGKNIAEDRAELTKIPEAPSCAGA